MSGGQYSRILIRATNWVGDAVMSLPAIRALRERFPQAHIAVLARQSVAGLYSRESAIDRIILYDGPRRAGARLRAEAFDCAILLQNAFEAALVAWLARIPRRIGYNRDGRRWLLTDAIPVPKPGEIPRHQRYYYLELLRRAGILEHMPACDAIRLERAEQARPDGIARFHELGIAMPVIGVSPGAAYGNAKRWPGERFAEAACRIAGEHAASIALFGSADERSLCESVAQEIRLRGGVVHNLAGQTTLAKFIELAAACLLFLTNDSGAMHIASALGVPTVVVFGATDDVATGPTGSWARVVRQPVECSPCLLRNCPIDHRCMTRVSSETVSGAALDLLKETSWTRAARS